MNASSGLTVTGPTMLRGRLSMPGDKSISHRALMLAALTPGASTICGLSPGEDVAHTRACLELLGAEIAQADDLLRVTSGELHEPHQTLNVGNAGTGIRLLAGLAASQPFLTVIEGDQHIARRPMNRVAKPLRMMGARIDGRDGGQFAPLAIRGGGIVGIAYELPIASAQVKSAILLATLAAEGKTTVYEPYISRAHTEEMLVQAGADVTIDGQTVTIRPSVLKPRHWDVPGDPSQAAFWICAAAGIPGSDLEVTDLYLGPARTRFLKVLTRMGADLRVDHTSRTVRVRGSELLGTEIEREDIPGLIDEIPALAVAAALAHGLTTIRGAEELRVKESDRIATTAAMLTAYGVKVTERSEGLDIHGGTSLQAGTVDSYGDHRIAMAGAVAALAATGTSTITGAEAIATSYPSFPDDLRSCATPYP